MRLWPLQPSTPQLRSRLQPWPPSGIFPDIHCITHKCKPPPKLYFMAYCLSSKRSQLCHCFPDFASLYMQLDAKDPAERERKSDAICLEELKEDSVCILLSRKGMSRWCMQGVGHGSDGAGQLHAGGPHARCQRPRQSIPAPATPPPLPLPRSRCLQHPQQVHKLSLACRLLGPIASFSYLRRKFGS